jgi:aspartate/methionine/tyrosine aminotransferase
MKNLTQLEIPRLVEPFNLTDGHIHRDWDWREKRIVSRVSDIFLHANRESQPDLERRYIEAFFKLGGQTVDYEKTKYMFCNSASASLEIVANYLRLNNMSLALIEPCFDNLADIFKRHKISLTPMPEKYLVDKKVGAFLRTLKTDAICIVSPNNPTGVTYTKENLETIARFCKRSKKLLIIDASFGLYNANLFDEYALLNKVGVDYICIEDTGKTWPTHDIKISVLACTLNLFKSLYDIYTDFLLHVSPFAIKLLTEFFVNSDRDNQYRIHEVVRRNRKALYDAIEDTFLEPVEEPRSSVAWLRIKNDLTAMKLKKILDKNGIFVLPGSHFFWSDRRKGDKFIRVALTRSPDKYRKAMAQLRLTLTQVNT